MSRESHIEFLEQIDPRELLGKIRRFRNLNISIMTQEAINNEIFDVLTFKGNFIYFTNSNFYPKGTKFFRARVLDGSLIPNRNLKIESDFWNAPSEFIRQYGRLNKPNESLLYTTPINPSVTLKEVKVPYGSYYALIIYEAKDEIKVNVIGQEYNYESLGIYSEKARLVNDIINDFLREEFCRDVGVGTEYLYCVSEFIAKSFFDLPPRVVQDAWAYPSLKDKLNYNVCFRPQVARELLELKGALIGQKQSQNDDIIVKCIAHGFDESGNAQFHKLGSDIQKSVFPEII
ncbi:hypothetical protein [Paenibacillus lycopersici]|uniref:hypothetical protein n=1 Tax=Paenibacillus lycopersici TaxID=2704462 RepID=UPI001CDD8A05|nr:hypothetical protein [Paenibacillus lycopersici]